MRESTMVRLQNRLVLAAPEEGQVTVRLEPYYFLE
jgi:hypothetical protein